LIDQREGMQTMSQLWVLILSAAVIFAPPVYSIDSVQTIAQLDCSSDLSDPYAPNEKMKFGKYKDQCIDSTYKRPLEILTFTEDTIEVANFRSGGKFYRAQIPLNKIDSLSHVVVDLDVNPANRISFKVSHSELRIKMAQPILLFSQTEESDSPVKEVNDLLISFNFAAPKGIPYNPFLGLIKGRFASVLQMFDFADEAETRFIKDKKNMYEIKLTTTNQQRHQIVKALIEESQKIQYNSPYATWTNNCTTKIFAIIDNALNLEGSVSRFKFGYLSARDTSFIPAIKAFYYRGLMADDTKIQSINEEFGQKIFTSRSNDFFQYWLNKTVGDAVQKNLLDQNYQYDLF
jgi:hypothetical protein